MICDNPLFFFPKKMYCFLCETVYSPWRMCVFSGCVVFVTRTFESFYSGLFDGKRTRVVLPAYPRVPATGCGLADRSGRQQHAAAAAITGDIRRRARFGRDGGQVRGRLRFGTGQAYANFGHFDVHFRRICCCCCCWSVRHRGRRVRPCTATRAQNGTSIKLTRNLKIFYVRIFFLHPKRILRVTGRDPVPELTVR